MHCPAAIDHADTAFDGMLRIPGGAFRMGSDRHYPEEAPAHRVTVDEFFIDRTPVTNRQFKDFVRATGHVTFAELPPDPKDYPGALPHMLYAGSSLTPVGIAFWPVVSAHTGLAGWCVAGLSMRTCEEKRS
jgi:formylglycine-generating enzyme